MADGKKPRPGKDRDARAPTYEVGYGKPPVASRFKPGQSGNPHGRPKGAKSRKSKAAILELERLKSVVIEEAYRPISVRDGDHLVDMPLIQAMIRSAGLNAVKGHHRSQQMLADLVRWVEGEDKELADEYLREVIDYKRRWDEELRHRKRTGDPGPEPLPHPDDIVIDMRSGEVAIRGPVSNEEREQWERLHQHKVALDKDIADVEKMLEEYPGAPSLIQELQESRQLRNRLSQKIPDDLPWSIRQRVPMAATRETQD